MPKIKKIDEIEGTETVETVESVSTVTETAQPEVILTVNQPENTVEIVQTETVVDPAGAKTTVSTAIKDLPGLSDEQKAILIDAELAKFKTQMQNSGYTLVYFTASEGYPRNQAGVLKVGEDILMKFLDFYRANKGPLGGEGVVRYLQSEFGSGIYISYPFITVANIN